VPFSALFEQATIEALAPIARASASRSWSPLAAIQPSGSDPPLFMIHPSGGTVFCYMALARELGPDQPVYGLEFPGLQDGRPIPSTVSELAELYAGVIRRTAAGPYRIGGWSSGGIVAFETARALGASGERVDFLALLDSEAPANLQHLRDIDSVDVALDMARLASVEIPFNAEELRALKSETFLSNLLERDDLGGVIPPSTSLQQLQRLVECALANVRMVVAYEPLPYPGTVHVFRASLSSPGFDRPRLARLGWAEHAARVDTHSVPGDHHSMVVDPQVRTLAEKMGSCLKRLRASKPGEPSQEASERGRSLEGRVE